MDGCFLMLATELHTGILCGRRHDYNGINESLRYKNGACVECAKITGAKYRKENHMIRLLIQKQYKIKNKDKIREQSRKYYGANKESIKIRMAKYIRNIGPKQRVARVSRQYRWCKKQRKRNTNYAIRQRIRLRIIRALTHYSDTGKIMTSRKYGIDYGAIIEHLGPHPNTIGIAGDFHIDHIIPLSAFDLTDPEQIKIAFAPENHQWLEAKANLAKHNKIQGQLALSVQKQLEAVL